MRSLFSVAMLAAVLPGCALVHRGAAFTSFGEPDPGGDFRIRERFDAVVEQGDPLSAHAESVQVLLRTLPPGISGNNGVISVDPGWAHRVVGTAAVAPGRGSIFSPYRSRTLRTVCHPQVVLTFATLGAWSLVPTMYPCFVKRPLPTDEILIEAKRLTSLAGGNAIVGEWISLDVERGTALGFEGTVLWLEDPKSRPGTPGDGGGA